MDVISNTAEIFAKRFDNACQKFDNLLMEIAGIDRETAGKVRGVMLKANLAKVDIAIGHINVVHGALLDKDFILHVAEKKI